MMSRIRANDFFSVTIERWNMKFNFFNKAITGPDFKELNRPVASNVMSIVDDDNFIDCTNSNDELIEVALDEYPLKDEEKLFLFNDQLHDDRVMEAHVNVKLEFFT